MMLLSLLVQLQSQYEALVVELVMFMHWQFCLVELVAQTNEVLFVVLVLLT